MKRTILGLLLVLCASVGSSANRICWSYPADSALQSDSDTLPEDDNPVQGFTVHYGPRADFLFNAKYVTDGTCLSIQIPNGWYYGVRAHVGDQISSLSNIEMVENTLIPSPPTLRLN